MQLIKHCFSEHRSICSSSFSDLNKGVTLKLKDAKKKSETRQLQSNTQKNEERKKAVKRMTGVRQNKSINENNKERENGAK